MTDQNDGNNESNGNNEILNEIQIKESNPNTSNKDLNTTITQKNLFEYSKKLHVGGTKLLVVDNENDVIGGEITNCCIIGSPKHVAALKAKVDELKSHSEQLEREREEALSRSESVSNQIDTLVKELSQLARNNNNSKNGEQTIHATIHTFGHIQNLEIIDDDDSSDDGNHKFDRLMRQPKVRQYWYYNKLYREAEERRVSFIELFWDLIFVAVIGNLGHDLVEDISGVNVERFILTFYPIYKIWLDMTIYMNMYSSNDLFEMLFLLFEMVLVITMGTHASYIFQNTISIYLVSYVIARMAFAFLHVLHATWIPLFRISFMNRAWGVFIPCIIWIVAIIVPSNRVSIIMWIAIIFEILWSGLMPLYIRFGRRIFYGETDTKEEVGFDMSRENTINTIDDPSSPTSQASTTTSRSPHKAMRTHNTEYQWRWKELFTIFKPTAYRPALNIEHYSERLGLFAIITLGEGILGVLYNSLNSLPDGQLGKSILGILIVYNLHWIYFIVDGSKQYQHALRRDVLSALLFITIHFPLNMALIAFGASLGAIVKLHDFSGAQSIPSQESYSSHTLLAELFVETSESVNSHDSHNSHMEFPSSLSWLYCATLAVSLYCMGIIGISHKCLDGDDYLRIPKSYRISLRFIIGTICLLLPLSNVNSLNLIIITSMLSLLLVVVETYGRLRRGLPLVGKCDNDVLHPEHRKYIRWRWGNKNLDQKTWSTGILRKRKREKRFNDGDGIIFE